MVTAVGKNILCVPARDELESFCVETIEEDVHGQTRSDKTYTVYHDVFLFLFFVMTHMCMLNYNAATVFEHVI